MFPGLAFFLLALGMGLFAVSIVLNDSSLPSAAREILVWVASLASIGPWLYKWLEGLRQETRLRQANRHISPLAEALTPQLFGDYSPYIVEAAEKLGEARDTSAVPALLWVLERCVDEQRAGWNDVAEKLVTALACIGDRRALPLLSRLESVRGIGFITAVRSAIASIDPQTSLLRPISASTVLPETLLRPAQDLNPDKDPTALLRAVESEAS